MSIFHNFPELFNRAFIKKSDFNIIIIIIIITMTTFIVLYIY